MSAINVFPGLLVTLGLVLAITSSEAAAADLEVYGRGAYHYLQDHDLEPIAEASDHSDVVATTILPPPQYDQVQNLPAFTNETDNQVMDIIHKGLIRLRNAGDRIKKFVDKIENGIKSGALNQTIADVKSKIENGKIDFHKLIVAYKQKANWNLDELIKRISDDSHVLLDKLHGRVDALGNHVQGNPRDELDESAEDHHNTKLDDSAPLSTDPSLI